MEQRSDVSLPIADRLEAGRLLAGRLGGHARDGGLLVLGLPRGGVPVAYEVARGLGAPLDVLCVRKLGVPGREELAMGAVASGGARVLNPAVLVDYEVRWEDVEAATRLALDEIVALEAAYRAGAPALPVGGRVTVLVDDGLATGATMRAAIAAVRRAGPRSVIVAVPVAPVETCAQLRLEADEVVCGATPTPFGAVGLWYRDFAPVPTEEVRELLVRSREQAY